jgi:L-2-aminoadipate reductase
MQSIGHHHDSTDGDVRLLLTFNRMGLLEFVMKDLPSNTRAPELEDFNTKRALRFDREQTGQDIPEEPPGVTETTIGLYLAYLVAIGFLPPPSSNGKKIIPILELSDEQKRALAGVGGRGGRQ